MTYLFNPKVDGIFDGIQVLDGAVGTPSISFQSDTNTGMYLSSADELSFAAGGVEGLRIDANESEVQPLMTLAVGPIELEEDSGAITVINLPVSATPSDGDEQSMSFSIDSNSILKVKASADGTGGADDFQVVISDAVITGGGLQLNHQVLTAATLTMDANDGIIECDTTSNAIAITLPECSTVLGQTLTVYFETDGANDVVLSTAVSDTFAGVGDIGDNTATMADVGDFIVIQAVSDTRWVVIQNNGATLSTV